MSDTTCAQGACIEYNSFNGYLSVPGYHYIAVLQLCNLCHCTFRFKAVLHGPTGPRPCLVNLYPDGTVLVTCAGTEMGQGLFTKVKQVSPLKQ